MHIQAKLPTRKLHIKFHRYDYDLHVTSKWIQFHVTQLHYMYHIDVTKPNDKIICKRKILD